MTLCNQCGGLMVPEPSAIVPALGCVACKRMIPMTGVRSVKVDRRVTNRALRAARRAKLRGAR